MVNNLHCNNVIKLLQAIKYCTLNNGAELYCIFTIVFQQTAADTFKKFKKSSKLKAPRTCTLTYDYKLQKMKLSL